MRATSVGLARAFTITLLVACSGERASAPIASEVQSRRDLSAQAFRLVIDTRSGHVDVAPPAGAVSSTSRLAPSFSLLGADAIAVTPGSCTFTSIPDKPKFKRCTLDLDLRNTLAATDLVTPTQFPRPPLGTTGVMAFPWTAVTETNEDVAPSPDWDLGPANFFNDFAGCSNGAKSDCYRYELFASPWYAGQTRVGQQVGFDLPVSAQQVTAYIVFAADLRDNPVRTVTLGPTAELCGFVELSTNFDPFIGVDGQYIYVGATTDDSFAVGFCSFGNTLPAGARIVNARLRLFRFTVGTSVAAERVDYGPTLEATDVPITAKGSAGTFAIEDPAFSSDNVWVTTNATSVVQAMVNESKSLFQFRLVAPLSATDFTVFAGSQPGAQARPQLVVQYTLP